MGKHDSGCPVLLAPCTADYAGRHRKPAPRIVERRELGGDWQHVARVTPDAEDAWQYMASNPIASGVEYRIRELEPAGT